MKCINLLPKEIQSKAANRRAIPTLLVTFVVASVAVGGLWIFWSTEKKSSEDRLVQAKDMAMVKATSKKGVTTNDSLTKLNTLNQYSKAEVDWVKVFAITSSLIPKDISLVNESVNLTTSGIAVKFSGTANSNVSYGGFVESLKQNELVMNVVTEKYNYDPKTGTVSYSINLVLKSDKLLFTNP